MKEKLRDRIHRTDVLVIGRGLAGLKAAHMASNRGAKVTIVSKGKGASPDIMGFNAPVGPGDSPDTYFEDIVQSGLYINNRKLARIMAEEAEKAVVELAKMGMHFDRKDSGYHLLQPLGCKFPRLVHYGSLTGAEATKLFSKESRRTGVIIFQDIMITDLLAHGGEVIVACGINTKDGNFLGFYAKSVVLATGGCGTLYPFSSYPVDTNSDGYAIGLEVGAELVDMEFMQFEPCGFVHPRELRGHVIPTTLLMEGGELRNKSGERFMSRYNSKKGEKVQKDELSRGMFKEIVEGRGTKHGGVYYDVSMLPRDLIVKGHSIFYKPALKAGIDITKEPAEVAPIAHTSLGGLRINERCETSIRGLFAAGEVSGGIHGANRIGGNAGTETLVFGARAGHYAADYALFQQKKFYGEIFTDLIRTKEKIYESYQSKKVSPLNLLSFKERIRDIMRREMSIVKNEKGLKEGLRELEELQKQLPVLSAKDTNDLVEIYKIKNMMTTAKMMITAGLTRKESRGVHYRDDFPERNDSGWSKNIVIQKSNGDFKIRLVSEP